MPRVSGFPAPSMDFIGLLDDRRQNHQTHISW